jgi:hypothetical protein
MKRPEGHIVYPAGSQLICTCTECAAAAGSGSEQFDAFDDKFIAGQQIAQLETEAAAEAATEMAAEMAAEAATEVDDDFEPDFLATMYASEALRDAMDAVIRDALRESWITEVLNVL